jgi:hypothetical protein
LDSIVKDPDYPDYGIGVFHLQTGATIFGGANHLFLVRHMFRTITSLNDEEVGRMANDFLDGSVHFYMTTLDTQPVIGFSVDFAGVRDAEDSQVQVFNNIFDAMDKLCHLNFPKNTQVVIRDSNGKGIMNVPLYDTTLKELTALKVYAGPRAGRLGKRGGSMKRGQTHAPMQPPIRRQSPLMQSHLPTMYYKGKPIENLDKVYLKSIDELPPVPEGHTRVYHCTKSNDSLAAIARDGIDLDKSTGYEAPKGMWWSSLTPDGYSSSMPLAVIDVPDDVMEVANEMGLVYQNVSADKVVAVYPYTDASFGGSGRLDHFIDSVRHVSVDMLAEEVLRRTAEIDEKMVPLVKAILEASKP